MPDIDLFPRNQVVGVFRGFTEGGMEFHADLILPYRNDFQSIPMHGQFLVVQLESPDEAVLGRIVSLSSEGKLAFGTGEDFNIRAMQDGRPVPEDLREQYLKYRINIRVLGVIRSQGGKLLFAPSHRRLPHVGSLVAFPTGDVLREIAGHNLDGAPIGHLALGEYVYSDRSPLAQMLPWMSAKTPEVLVKFPVENLVSRRSFVFARAGFGKSNLTKLLFSTLYASEPVVLKRGGKRVPVGTIIFDPDGEYFWPDDRGRPGLCDVPELSQRLVVFTLRQAPSPFYGSFVAGGIKLDIRRLAPADVIGIALSPEKQDQQNVGKLKGMSQERWRELVELIYRDRNSAPIDEIARLLNLDPLKQEYEALAARSNMTIIVNTIHDPSSRLMDMLIEALSQGKLCVVDVSKMRGAQALILSGLILRRIFDRNQQEFTAAEPRTIPTIAVVEEAQSVLNERSSAAQPYLEWVKEGRKYDLGAVLITQQPGSIPVEILSQGDNWFIFHLLSAADLINLQRANAHFSEDILSALLNEPISGQGVFWSSASGRAYPVPIRALSFEKMYSVLDAAYNRRAEMVYASQLRQRFEAELGSMLATTDGAAADESDAGVDPLALMEEEAIQRLSEESAFAKKLFSSEGVMWRSFIEFFENALPGSLENRSDVARGLVRKALDRLGKEGEAWVTFQRPSKTQAGRNVLCVRAFSPDEGR